MKRIVALLLVLLLIPSALFGCAAFPVRSDSGNGTESDTKKTETENETRDETPSSPEFAEGDVLRLCVALPETEFAVGGKTRIPACRLEFEFYRSTRAFSMELTVGEKTFRAGCDGEYLCVPRTDGDGVLVMTPEAFVSELGEDGGTAEDIRALIPGVILKEILFGAGNVGSLPADLLLSLLPEETLTVFGMLREMLPEKMGFPSYAFADGNVFERLLSESEKTSGEDGTTVFTADLGSFTERLGERLMLPRDLFDRSPASLYDEWHGTEGAYRTGFGRMRASVGGDETVGELFRRVIVSVNEKGFRLTEKRVLDLIDALYALAGKEFPGGSAEAVYRSVADLSLDRFLSLFGENLTTEVLFGELDRLLTESTVGALTERVLGEGNGRRLRSAWETFIAALDGTDGTLSLVVTKDGKILSAASDLNICGKKSVSADLTVTDTASLTVLAHPAIDGIRVTKNADGDTVLAGLPDGATVRIDAGGEWRSFAEKGSADPPSEFDRAGVFCEPYGGYLEEKLLRADGDTVTVSHLLADAAEELIRLSPDFGEVVLPSRRVFCSYRFSVSVLLVLSDGTECILTPRSVLAVSSAELFRP